MDKNLKLFSARYRASKYRNTLKLKRHIKQISINRQNKKLRSGVESKIKEHCGNSNDLRKEPVFDTQESISVSENKINNQDTNSDDSSECNNDEIYEENEDNDVNDPETHVETEPTDADKEKKLRAWALECQVPQSTLDKLLNIFRTRLMPSLPKSAKTFLQTNTATYKIITMTDSDGTEGQFTYFGIKQGLQSCVNNDIHNSNTLNLIINIDGIKLFKSSAKVV